MKYKNLKFRIEDLYDIYNLMNKNNVLIEINFKYGLPNLEWIYIYKQKIKSNYFVFGADVHSLNDLYNSWQIKQKFKNRLKRINENNIAILR